jgi:FdhD protein
MSRLRIGISSCLLGQRVRYDGEHKLAGCLTALEPHVEWIPVCPEVEVGMGVPREPVRLERRDGVRMIGIDSRRDWTADMQRWAGPRIDSLLAAGISGYVFKKNSPSCGVSSVKVFETDRVDPAGRGLFAQALLERLPRLPVEEEDRLADPRVRDAFLERCRAYRDGQPFRRVRVARYVGPNFSSGSPTDVGPNFSSGRPTDVGPNFSSGRPTDVGPNFSSATHDDAAATEEPLEVRLHGKPFAVIMRTPGADRDLAAGFLFAEGVITSAADVGAIEQCRHPEHPEIANVVDVFLVGGAVGSVAAHLDERRRVLTTSSCGLCGRATIESLRVRAVPLPESWTIAPAFAASLPDRLRAFQTTFDETGGLHAAAVFDFDGRAVANAEDVGRHSAVDKTIGRLLLDGRLPLTCHVLVVSGRASYEIVQKAWLAGIACVCAVSAPSTLAIDLAQEAGITLLGFARGGSFNVYTHAGRIANR